MGAEVTITVTALALSVVFYAAIGVFGIWAYRNAHMRSGLWLTAYLVVDLLGGFATPYFWRRLIDHLAQDNLLHPFPMGAFLMSWQFGLKLVNSIALLALGLMVFADIAHLTSAAGIDTSAKPIAWLDRVRTKQTILGVIAVVSSLILLMTPLALYYYYS